MEWVVLIEIDDDRKTGRKDMQAEEKMEKSQSEIWAERGRRVFGDSLGLLQKRRRWTACDGWRLSVDKKKVGEERGRDRRRARGWHEVCGKWYESMWLERQMWNHYWEKCFFLFLHRAPRAAAEIKLNRDYGWIPFKQSAHVRSIATLTLAGAKCVVYIWGIICEWR